MKSWQTLFFFIAATGAIASALPERGGARDMLITPTHESLDPAEIEFSVMTYNVHGLPWPLAKGRAEAFACIEERLLRLRRANMQPHVVVLQEAFTTRAREIGSNAGYRYIVDGPDRDADNPSDSAGAALASGASFGKAETIGKWIGSGLQLLSDYPVLSVKRMAFPAADCAGYDCLANKGALMVTLQVPGQAAPVAVVTTHMNSRKSSGVPEARSQIAYQLQAATLARFVRDNHDERTPIVFAGDFNASNASRRRILGDDVATALPTRSHAFESALQTVAAKVVIWPARLQEDVAYVSKRGRDWQFFASGSRAGIAPRRIGIPFGREPDGTMLSDHMGLMISYRLTKSG